MDKKNLLIIAGVLIIILLTAAGTSLLRRPADVQEDTVIITVDGAEYARVPLSSPRTVTVDQGDGTVNVIEVSNRGAVMHSSTCDNQLCVNMGAVTLDNWELRPNQQFIVCLPNRVTVELAVREAVE